MVITKTNRHRSIMGFSIPLCRICCKVSASPLRPTPSSVGSAQIHAMPMGKHEIERVSPIKGEKFMATTLMPIMMIFE